MSHREDVHLAPLGTAEEERARAFKYAVLVDYYATGAPESNWDRDVRAIYAALLPSAKRLLAETPEALMERALKIATRAADAIENFRATRPQVPQE